MGRPGQAGAAESSQESDSGCSLPPSACRCFACSQSSTASRAVSAPPPPPKGCLLSETAKQEPISPTCPPGRGDPLFRPPAQISPAPSPRAATRAGRQGWSTNGTDFISDHLFAHCWRAGSGLCPALAMVPHLNGTWQSGRCPRHTRTCPGKHGPPGSGERGSGRPPPPGSSDPAAERQKEMVSKGVR